VIPRERGFPPVADPRARVLVLGSFPGQASLAAGHYYAHPRNQFWRLIGGVLGEDLAALDWHGRYDRLREHRIALWDVVAECVRPGSLDADIAQADPNDLDDLLGRLTELRTVIFNGGTAARLARRLHDAGFEVHTVPSSSPAHASLSFDDKLARWRRAFGVDRRRRHRSVPVPITLSESDGIRYLHFGSPWVQGAMLIGHPHLLVLDYVQRMMAWMLFRRAPADLLQLGLGAGALTRFTHRFLPQTRTTVVDCSQDVIDVAGACFALPGNDPRLTVRCDDAGAVVAAPRANGRYGVIQVDLYDQDARGPVLDSEAFYRDCRRALSAKGGVAVFNLFGRHRSYAPNLRRLRAAFDGRLLVLPPTPAGNRVVLGFAGPPMRMPWSAVHQRAQWLEERFGWPATQWSAWIERDHGGAVCDA